jgi:protein involved in polysaccharide export with SLBB domain
MVKTRRSVVQFVGLLLTFAGLMQANLLASYAQSTGDRTKNQYFIIGAAKAPGVYRIESAPSLLKLLALAGGLADSHGAVAFIIRKLPAQAADQDPAFKVIQIRIDQLLKGNLEAPADLEPGDIVSIPQADVFFVSGEVVRPGSFPFKDGMTLLQAISVARGLKAGAKADKAIIFREDRSTGKRQEITVDLDAVTSGKQKDIPLLPNDIVVVPNSRAGITPWPRFLEAPPIPVFAPCRASRPCMARLDLSQFEPANKQD